MHASLVSLTPAKTCKLAIFTARYQRHRRCMMSLVSTAPVRNASPVSLTPVTSCITGVVDTKLILYRSVFYTLLILYRTFLYRTYIFYITLILYETFYTVLFYTKLILYQTFLYQTFLYRTLFTPNSFYTELGGGEGTGVASWRGWRSL
jgi:hypothetical protein